MEISKNGGQVTYEFTYNDAGIRTSKNVNGSIHHYALDGSQILSESWGNHFILYLYDESGAPIGLKYRTASYAAGVFDTYYFEKNIFGDIVAIYTENGVKVGSYTYDAWGNITTTVSAGNTSIQNSVVRNFNPFRYRGYFYDYETGLYYLQSRYYDPATGRFINVDGYISTGTGLLGYNMYAYCNNNPVMYVDPFGYFGISTRCELEERYDILRDESEVGAGSAYYTYAAYSRTAAYDADLYGYYFSGMTTAANNILYYYFPGAVTVTDDMAVQPAEPVNTTRGWKVGDDITNLTKDGNRPSWTTVRQRYWKNEAHYHPDLYSDEDLALMKQGRAPIVDDRPLHLHHPNGREGAFYWDFYPVTYEQHHFEHYGW